MKLKEILDVTCGKPLNVNPNIKVEEFVIDSRKAKKGSFFIPLKGTKADGHDFIEHAVKSGAVGFFTERQINGKNGILVEDSLKALTDIGKFKRKNISQVVGITGTSGKTTTKEIAKIVLSEFFRVSSTYGNYNNHIGLPLSLANSKDSDIGVFEIGTNKVGDIPYLMDILRPDIGVLTSVGYAHTEGFKSFEDIVYEKGEIFRDVRFAVLPDELLPYYESELTDYITFGYGDEPDIKISEISVTEEGTEGIISYKEDSIKVRVPVINRSILLNIGALAGILYGLDINPVKALAVLEGFKGVDGRGKVIKYKTNTIIDDTYNANPLSVYNAIKTLESVDKKRILVLGDMLELGHLSEKLHREIGKVINRSRLDEVYLYGKEVKFTAEEINKKSVYLFNDKKDLALKIMNQEHSVILIKGSRGMKMEEVLNHILE